jgi:hypothetical protein
MHVEQDDHLERREGVAHLLELGGLLRRGHEREPRAGILDDVLSLRGRERRVNGNRDAARAEDREIDDQPFRACLRHQDDAISRLQADGAEPQADVANALEEVLRGQPVDAPLAASPHCLRLGVAAQDVEGDVGQCGELRRRLERNGRFRHDER